MESVYHSATYLSTQHFYMMMMTFWMILGMEVVPKAGLDNQERPM